mgnify:CR=1 FL=1
MLSTILAFKALTTRNRHDLTRVEMILVDTKQRPLFEVRRFLPQPYPVGSFYDVLERFGGILIRASDFPAHHQEQGGSDAYCPVLLSKLVLLQRHHSWSDRETVHRARCDMAVKAAREVRIGDLLEVRQGPVVRVLKVAGLSQVRGPAPVAQALYDETPESRLARESAAAQRRMGIEPADAMMQGRPTKRDRRQLVDWQRWSASTDDKE